ncbi:MAG: DUF87 domain-containing protein [Candidatus Micrarchaeaceae archaeon]
MEKIKLGKVLYEMEFKRRKMKWFMKRVRFKNFYVKSLVNNHILITGMSGTGKSSLCLSILCELCKSEKGFLIIDVCGDYSRFAKSLDAKIYNGKVFSVNPFAFGEEDAYLASREAISIFEKALRLGDVQKGMLFKCILYTYRISMEKRRKVTMSSLIYTVKTFIKHADREKEKVLRSIYLRLLSTWRSAKEVSLDEVGKRSIFDISCIGSDELQRIYADSIFKQFYYFMRKGVLKDMLLVVDEAHKFDSTYLEKIAAEGRKYGVGLICIAQSPKSVVKEVRTNAYLTFSFFIKEPEGIDYVANLIASGHEGNRFIEVKKMIRSLRVGEAITNYEGVKVIKFRRESIEKDALYWILNNIRYGIEANELNDELIREGFSWEEIDRGIAHGLSTNMIRKCIINGRLYYTTSPFNSPFHEAMIGISCKELERNGIRYEVLNRPGTPDIVAYSKDGAVAIECETGAKGEKEICEMLKRRSEYKRVIVVSLQQNAMKEGRISIGEIENLGKMLNGASEIGQNRKEFIF